MSKWTVFRHNGPFFPQEYQRHNIDILINGIKVNVPSIVEEYLTMYAKYIGTEYITKTRFNNNFLKDLKKVLPNNIKINDMKDINLSFVKQFLDNKKNKIKSLSKEIKEKLKEKQRKIEEPYTIMYIDGHQQKVGNYKIEPAGIFLGRGNHPKLGRIKHRILPKDVIINLDKKASIPKPNIGGNWKKVIHDKNVIWLATWNDEITGKNKYVFTSMEGTFKSKSDEKKFNLAHKLKNKVGQIRKEYNDALVSSNIIKRQLATALYFIDNFALRIGNKKNTKEKADTVGVTSLRIEHIQLLNNNIIKLNFLGKDSIRYCKKSQVSPEVYNNLKKFTEGKDKKDDLFNKVSSTSLNDYLNNFMKGLTAKVWRTYNASNTLQKELNKVNETKIDKMPEQEKILYLTTFFNQANTTVALLCNHQKNISSNIDNIITKIENQIKKLRKRKKKTKDRDKLNKINAKLETLKLKKETKSKMKNVSLGTSKTNYIDPRIIFTFIKKYKIPPEKIFTKQLLKRFEWARDINSNYKF
jgi:DNA topoisomerase-1